MSDQPTPKLTRVTMSARYYAEMQKDLAEAVQLCNECYSAIRASEGTSYSQLAALIHVLDGRLRDIRIRIETYCSPL